MEVYIGLQHGQRRVELTKDDVLGRGGEAVIYVDPGEPNTKVLKVYHQPDFRRAQKLEAMINSKIVFPPRIIGPTELVYANGRIVGFQMNRLGPLFNKLNALFKASFCRDHGFSLKVKTQLFAAIGEDVQTAHKLGLIIGDLNDANVMVEEQKHQHAWIDVDSWQYRDYACIVGTQLYLVPTLYNVDLSKGPMFKPEYDWWSFAVLLVRVLLDGIHPFKSGIHSQYVSVLDRAANGITVFDADVEKPKVGMSPDVLSDELTEEIIKILKRKKGEFPLERLKEYGDILIECKNCGIWYPMTRKQCPGCAEKTVIDLNLAKKIAELLVTDMIVTQGRILYYQKAGETIYCIAEESGELVVYKKEKNIPALRTQTGFDHVPGERFGIFQGLLVVCREPTKEEAELYVLEVTANSITPVQELSTIALKGSRAVFGCSERFLYRIAERTLLCGDTLTTSQGKEIVERAVMQVYKGQTWFTVAPEPGPDQEIIFGFHREFNQYNWFLVRGDKSGKNFIRHENLSLTALQIGESLMDLAVYFTPKSILLIRQISKRGKIAILMETISVEDGKVLASHYVQDPNNPKWETIHGKVMSSKFLMHASNGIVREKIEDETTITILGSENYVLPEEKLDRYSGGILVVKNDRIILIEPKGGNA